MIVGMATRIVSVDAIRATLEESTPEEIAATWTQAERDTCMPRVDPAPGLAARLAAKQATLEALGLRDASDPSDASLLEVEIRRAESGKPSLVLHGAAFEAARALGAERRHVTLTHLDSQALAVVILEGPA